MNTRSEAKPEKTEMYFDSLFNSLDAREQVEVRYKLPDKPMKRTFCSDLDLLVRECVQLGQTHDVYVGVAPRTGRVGTKEGVTRLSCTWADLDVQDERTRSTRLEQLNSLPHLPSMLVDSGGGFHPYFFLIEAAQSPAEMERAERVMQMLAQALDGDPVHDRTRILRVPGTFNHKKSVPRPVRLVHCEPDRRYSLDQLEHMATQMIDTLPKQHPETKPSKTKKKVQREILAAPIREGERNNALTSVGGTLRDRGMDGKTIQIVLLEVNRLRCEPPVEEDEVRRIAASVSEYACGAPRYRMSTARRIHPEGRDL